MRDVKFLGEDDFLSAMETENKLWRTKYVTRGQLKGPDGTDFNYYIANPKGEPRASITLVHGLDEFFGKYHEYIWYLTQAGYKVFFMEQRGHGYSGGKNIETDTVYIDSYDTYVNDLRSFVERVVLKGSRKMKRVLIAHSMGGAVAARFLELYPKYFSAAILSSPMLKMKADGMTPPVVAILKAYAIVFCKMRKLAPKQTHFNPNTEFEKSSALSRPRFEYQLKMRLKDEHYQTAGATFGWAFASLKVNKDIMKNTRTLTMPIYIMTAGNDHLIDPEGYQEFHRLVPGQKIYHYENSKHEIFNADEASRKAYFNDVLTILEDYARK